MAVGSDNIKRMKMVSKQDKWKSGEGPVFPKVSEMGKEKLGKLRRLMKLEIKLKMSPDLYIYGQLVCSERAKIIQ